MHELPVLYRVEIPRPPLTEFVAVLWYWKGHEMPKATERVLPKGTVELVINLSIGRPGNSGVLGPQSGSFLIERTARDELVGIHFKPGGLFPVVGFPVDELRDRSVSLSDIWGQASAGRLVSRLHEAATVDAKFCALEAWLLRNARRPFAHHPAVSYAMNAFLLDPGVASSARVAERVNLCQRRLIRVFRDEVGLTPKLFCRIRRFHNAINSIGAHAAVDWLDLAHASGYYDQSHFIREFREFAGISPTEYLRLRIANQPGHVQVPS